MNLLIFNRAALTLHIVKEDTLVYIFSFTNLTTLRNKTNKLVPYHIFTEYIWLHIILSYIFIYKLHQYSKVTFRATISIMICK